MWPTPAVSFQKDLGSVRVCSALIPAHSSPHVHRRSCLCVSVTPAVRGDVSHGHTAKGRNDRDCAVKKLLLHISPTAISELTQEVRLIRCLDKTKRL